jgi:hypothetical protein
MRKALTTLAMAALLLAGAGLAGCASKCCDGNPPCADCRAKMGCPDCKDGKPCEMCAQKMKAMGCPDCKDGMKCANCEAMHGK